MKIKFIFIITTAILVLTLSCKKSTKKPKDLPEQPSPTIDTSQRDTLSKIIIDLSGMKNSNGNINIAIYNSSSSFNDPNNAYRKIAVSATSGSMIITLEGIPQGTYAIGLFHDENTNNIIDKNFIGIPKEGFAFSNNATANFGPPSFGQASFYLPAKSSLTQILSLIFY